MSAVLRRKTFKVGNLVFHTGTPFTDKLRKSFVDAEKLLTKFEKENEQRSRKLRKTTNRF